MDVPINNHVRTNGMLQEYLTGQRKVKIMETDCSSHFTVLILKHVLLNDVIAAGFNRVLEFVNRLFVIHLRLNLFGREKECH
jgi:hypothetical protein